MNDEILRRKYRNLYYQLLTIRKQFNKLDEIYGNLKNNVKSSLLVDNNLICDADFLYLEKQNSIVKDEFTSVVIPSVRRKM